MNLLRNRSFLASSLAHLAVDILNSTRTVYLAFLGQPLGLSNTAIGLINTAYTLLGSLTQPLFGYFADRSGSRRIVVMGVLWIALFFALAQIIPGSAALGFLIFAALGSAAFHPAGTMIATMNGRDRLSQNETTAASVFFLFGQAGLSLGPALGGPILDQWGLPGLLLLLVYVIPVGINAGVSLPAHDPTSRGEAGTRLHFAMNLLVMFVALTAIRSWVQLNMISFLPKYLSDLGYAPAVYGPIAALFMGGSALGGVAGGYLGDRYRKMSVVAIAMFLATFPLIIYPRFGLTPVVYPLTLATGVLTGIPHSNLVVIAQRMLPGKAGVASGLILGFTFASGSLGTLISGVQADQVGFEMVFFSTGGLSLVAGLLALFLKNLERQVFMGQKRAV